jgi:hypothetical protein
MVLKFRLKYSILTFLSIVLFSFSSSFSAQTFIVDSQETFNDALGKANSGDTIEWVNGLYENIYLNINKGDVIVKAKERGSVTFTGNSRVLISADDVILDGFQFLGGNIGTQDVIKTTGSNNLFVHLNIKDYVSYKYLVIKEECRNNTVAYCNFENRINLDDQNILSILVDKNKPGYHKVQYCSFKNFNGTGNDLGIEPIRIGVSTQSEFISRTIVEHCYFTQCNGDGELISNKARQNIFRYNTFFDNPVAELVLRHGDEGIVYGNFFLDNMGGVRVREGKNHFIFNNYFSGLTKRSIYLQNEPSDPLENITILYNTIVNSAEFILGGDGGNKPKSVTIANNIFLEPKESLFEDRTGTEVWKNNLAFGSLGISSREGITEVDPKLIENEFGYLEISAESPAVKSAASDYPKPPQIDNLEYDYQIRKDIMENTRPNAAIGQDIGCLVFPVITKLRPTANAGNTGPSYLWSQTTSIEIDPFLISFKAFPNPVTSDLHLHYSLDKALDLEADLLDSFGRVIKPISSLSSETGDHSIKISMEDLPSGLYFLSIRSRRKGSSTIRKTTYQIIKLE